jgi:hypothetical protein
MPRWSGKCWILVRANEIGKNAGAQIQRKEDS